MKPVTKAWCKKVIFIQDVGQVGPTLPPTKTLANFKMTLLDSGDLLLEWEQGAFLKSYTVSQSMIEGCLHPATPKPAANS